MTDSDVAGFFVGDVSAAACAAARANPAVGTRVICIRCRTTRLKCGVLNSTQPGLLDLESLSGDLWWIVARFGDIDAGALFRARPSRRRVDPIPRSASAARPRKCRVAVPSSIVVHRRREVDRARDVGERLEHAESRELSRGNADWYQRPGSSGVEPSSPTTIASRGRRPISSIVTTYGVPRGPLRAVGRCAARVALLGRVPEQAAAAESGLDRRRARRDAVGELLSVERHRARLCRRLVSPAVVLPRRQLRAMEGSIWSSPWLDRPSWGRRPFIKRLATRASRGTGGGTIRRAATPADHDRVQTKPCFLLMGRCNRRVDRDCCGALRMGCRRPAPGRRWLAAGRRCRQTRRRRAARELDAYASHTSVLRAERSSCAWHAVLQHRPPGRFLQREPAALRTDGGHGSAVGELSRTVTRARARAGPDLYCLSHDHGHFAGATGDSSSVLRSRPRQRPRESTGGELPTPLARRRISGLGTHIRRSRRRHDDVSSPHAGPVPLPGATALFACSTHLRDARAVWAGPSTTTASLPTDPTATSGPTRCDG